MPPVWVAFEQRGHVMTVHGHFPSFLGPAPLSFSAVGDAGWHQPLNGSDGFPSRVGLRFFPLAVPRARFSVPE